jgi:hypothetical protein
VACQQFREELKKRDTIWEEVVRVYDPVETEPYALCRFLRARHFNVVKVLDMISETLEIWREARKHDYFPGEPRHTLSLLNWLTGKKVLYPYNLTLSLVFLYLYSRSKRSYWGARQRAIVTNADLLLRVCEKRITRGLCQSIRP